MGGLNRAYLLSLFSKVNKAQKNIGDVTIDIETIESTLESIQESIEVLSKTKKYIVADGSDLTSFTTEEDSSNVLVPFNTTVSSSVTQDNPEFSINNEGQIVIGKNVNLISIFVKCSITKKTNATYQSIKILKNDTEIGKSTNLNLANNETGALSKKVIKEVTENDIISLKAFSRLAGTIEVINPEICIEKLG